MMTIYADRTTHGFDWIDITAPEKSELEPLASRYDLHEAALNDCLQPGHLPKYEPFRNHTFIILRFHITHTDREADTVEEITNKVAIFIGENYILTLHRKPWPAIEVISEDQEMRGKCQNPTHVLNEVVRASLMSYDGPANELTELIEFYERQVFLTQRRASLLKGLYFVKRKLDVIKRLLLLSHEVVDRIDAAGRSDADTRDIRDLYVRQRSLYDSLAENANHLMNIYFNISAQRTNETMRILTIFSVFFMPLTFIVGVYGMNFAHMPELQWKYGYPGIMVLMIAVIVVIYVWFKRKKWM